VKLDTSTLACRLIVVINVHYFQVGCVLVLVIGLLTSVIVCLKWYKINDGKDMVSSGRLSGDQMSPIPIGPDAFVMTLNDLQGHLLQCDFWYCCAAVDKISTDIAWWPAHVAEWSVHVQ